MTKHPWYVRLAAGLLGVAFLAFAAVGIIVAVQRSWMGWVMAPAGLGFAALFLHAAVYGFDPSWVVPDEDQRDT